MESLVMALASALEQPREVTAQVVHHLITHHDLDRADIGAFLTNELPRLEDYEVELILSPLFTPTLHDQAPIADLLGADSIPNAQWPSLIQQLAARPTVARLITADAATHPVPLRAVILERFVHRLQLDGTIAAPLLDWINHLAPSSDRPLLKAVARRAIWKAESRREILMRHLTATSARDSCRLEDVLALLQLIEIYQPADLQELLARMPQWEQVLHHEINLAASPKAFFNERVEELHGGGRDQRRQSDRGSAAKEQELAFLKRLRESLAAPS